MTNVYKTTLSIQDIEIDGKPDDAIIIDAVNRIHEILDNIEVEADTAWIRNILLSKYIVILCIFMRLYGDIFYVCVLCDFPDNILIYSMNYLFLMLFYMTFNRTITHLDARLGNADYDNVLILDAYSKFLDIEPIHRIIDGDLVIQGIYFLLKCVA